MNRASNMKEKLDKALSKHYYNAKTVGSFGGIHNLSKTSKKIEKQFNIGSLLKMLIPYTNQSNINTRDEK